MAARSSFLGRLQGCCAWDSIICKLTILVVDVLLLFFFNPPSFCRIEYPDYYSFLIRGLRVQEGYIYILVEVFVT